MIMKGNANGVGGSLMALANTRRGKPLAVIADKGVSVTVQSFASDSLAVASLVANDNLETARPLSKQPLTRVFGGPVGSSAGASGYHELTKPGSFTASFRAANQTSAIAVAVFEPAY